MSATALSSWTKAIRKALDARGVDSAALMAQAGLDSAALADPNGRLPVRQTAGLWRLAVAATGDPAFALTVARHVTPTTFHALGYSQVASTTLREAFERTLRYFRVVTDAGELNFHQDGDRYIFEARVETGGDGPAEEGVEALMAVMVRMCRGLSAGAASPLAVSLARSEPEDTAPYHKAFRVPVRFGAAVNSLEFSRQAMEMPLEGANPELARHNDQIVIDYLARIDKSQIASRVRSILIEALPDGVPSAEQVAKRLYLSARSLQRRLAEEDTSYTAMLEQTREQLARSYLADHRYSVSEITFVLGFSDVSAFSRAFRRWTGQSPSDFRQRLGD